jgi:hypothetical protein
MSGACARVVDVLDRACDVRSERSVPRRTAISPRLAAALIVGTAGRRGGDGADAAAVPGPATAIASWPVTAPMLWAAVTLVIRLAPAGDRPPQRVTFGPALVIVAWLVTSHVRLVPDDDRAVRLAGHGGRLLTYRYSSVMALLSGGQLDALIRRSAARGG